MRSVRLTAMPHGFISRLGHQLTPRLLLGMVLVLGILLGVPAGLALPAPVAHDDRMVIGNTSGGLAALLLLDGARVIVGGGRSRADLVSLVDRSMLPWERRIDLLILPARAPREAVGAIGLIERGHVARVALVGTPNDDPAWTVLLQEADRTGAIVEYVTVPSRVSLPGSSELLITPPEDRANSGPATIAVRYGGARLMLVDVPAGSDGQRAISAVQTGPAAVLVSLSAPSPSAPPGTALLVRPAPQGASEMTGPGAQFVADLDRGEWLTVDLRPGELRMPLNRVTRVSPPGRQVQDAATPAAP